MATDKLRGAILVTMTVFCAGAACNAEEVVALPTSGAAACSDITLIPVATDAGVKCVTARGYTAYTRDMGHLPIMTKEYIFGRTIPMPKTDKSGHVILPSSDTLDIHNERSENSHPKISALSDRPNHASARITIKQRLGVKKIPPSSYNDLAGSREQKR